MKIFVYDNDCNLTNYLTSLNKFGYTSICSKEVNLSSECDGLLLTGGGDINPLLYGEKLEVNANYTTTVDFKELFLLKSFISFNKPIMGICKGMQLINVFFGGTLKNILNHQSNKDIFHPILWNNYLPNLKNKPLIVNSNHHQAIEKLAKDLVVLAKSNDGVIESVTHKKLKILGVQFHPERLDEITCKTLFDFIYGYPPSSCTKRELF